ncbi:eudesmanediol synthase-like [Oryza glaberrima]|uniref:Terpene synthase N-terminal domain-containing protein n=2 Tax=Oryza TaxID=4527 RepID=A0A0D3FIR3_9ORYZ|nr:eudesmanediol synthase-like [Oryza glaberrima]
MSGSKVISVLNTEMLAVNGGTPQLTASATATAQTFAPSVWGDFFATYAPPNSKRSEKWTRERAEELKVQVRSKLLKAKSSSSAADMVMLVDTLERLGIDNHFRHEIAAMLHRVHREQQECTAGSGDDDDDDLHITSLQFHLLRKHGFRVSAAVFDKFIDSKGSFRASLSSDTRGLLSLYNAAHMAMPGEEALDDAIAFARHHLRSIQGKLRSPMAEQVSRALDIPLPRTPRRLETMRYIAEYEHEPAFDGVALELAKLDFELVRSLHLRELKALTLWWKDMFNSVKLSYARDRIVETYFWTCGIYHEEEYSRARIIFTKVFGLMSLMNDTYDAHATLEECHKLNKAIQRWDKSAVSILPEYLHVFYIKLLNNFHELEDCLEPTEKYRISYAKTGYKHLSEYYLREAQWSSDRYMPSFAEHLDVSAMSSGFPQLAPVVLLGVRDGDGAATAEAFGWAAAVPALVHASGELARFLNDTASYKIGKRDKDIPSTVECHMAERGVEGEEAVAAVAAMAERAWRTINRECVEMDRALLPAAQLVVNLTRMLEVIYLGGRDGYTAGADIKDLVTNFFLATPSQF